MAQFSRVLVFLLESFHISMYPGPMKKISISDVAKYADVSIATTSYALSGSGRVAKKTREKVLKAAGELGFIRDESAVRLRTGRSTMLGVIINDISNPFFNEFVASFEATAWAEGYMTILCTSQDDFERQNRLLSGLVSQGVAGVVISPALGTGLNNFPLLEQRNIPNVLCVRGLDDENNFVGTDDLAAGKLAARYLLENGHRHLCFVGGYQHTTTWVRRKLGIQLAIEEFGDGTAVFEVVSGGEGSEFGRTSVGDILRRKETQHPAIVGFNDMTAIGAYQAINEAGESVGRSVSVVGIDNIPASAQVLPGLTTVEIFPRRLGEVAARQLIEQIKGSDRVDTMTMIKPALVERDSVACLGKTS